MNSILFIHPYKSDGIWAFDDPAVGLVREPFVAGADVMLDKMTAHIPNAEKGVTVLFSAQRFPGAEHELSWSREEADGNWYHSEELGMEAWLCPALFKYFDLAPERIFVQVKPKS